MKAWKSNKNQFTKKKYLEETVYHNMNSNVHCTPSLFKILTKSLYLLTEIGVGEHKRPEV